MASLASTYDWKSPEAQTGLTELTFAYLDKEGNGGRLFWPDDEASPNSIQSISIHERQSSVLHQSRRESTSHRIPSCSKWPLALSCQPPPLQVKNP